MKFKKNSGLTLLEVIISLAILGIIVAPILSMTLTSVKISKSSEDKILATSLAQQCTEYIKIGDIRQANFQMMIESELGLKKLSTTSTSDNENSDKIKSMLNGDPEIQDYYLYNGDDKQKYKNIITKITYNIDAEVAVTEYSDMSNYNMIITVDKDNEISIMDNKGRLIASSEDKVLSEGNIRPIFEITNNASDVECSVKQGNVDLLSGVKIGKDSNATGKVKIIFKSTSNINIDVYAKNMLSSNGNLALNVLKTLDSKYGSTVIENDGVNSDYISEQYETFDANYKDPNKLMKNYLVNIEVWYYDSVSNTKTLMQQVKTYKPV